MELRIRITFAIIFILAGLVAYLFDSELLPSGEMDPEGPDRVEPFLAIAVDPPPGGDVPDVRPEIELILRDRNSIQGIFQVVHENPNVSGNFRFVVVGPPTMTVVQDPACPPLHVRDHEFAVGIEYTSGTCPNFALNGFQFSIPKGTKDVLGSKTHVVPSQRLGIARHRFLLRMEVFGYRGQQQFDEYIEGFEPVERYRLKFSLGSRTYKFAQLTPEPNLTEVSSSGWVVNEKLTSQPDADYFSATVVHTVLDSMMDWSRNFFWLGVGFFLASIEPRRRRKRQIEST
jgi:hypothetical protein